jgi:hypothetical protein
MRKLIARISVLVVLMVPLAVIVQQPAQAATASPNGCTIVPDWNSPLEAAVGDFWNFHNACNQHDLCYRDRWYQGAAADPRAACDLMFYNAMARSCPWFNWARCTARAEVYYRGVRLFGGWFYNHSDQWVRVNVRIA